MGRRAQSANQRSRSRDPLERRAMLKRQQHDAELAPKAKHDSSLPRSLRDMMALQSATRASRDRKRAHSQPDRGFAARRASSSASRAASKAAAAAAAHLDSVRELDALEKRAAKRGGRHARRVLEDQRRREGMSATRRIETLDLDALAPSHDTEHMTREARDAFERVSARFLARAQRIAAASSGAVAAARASGSGSQPPRPHVPLLDGETLEQYQRRLSREFSRASQRMSDAALAASSGRSARGATVHTSTKHKLYLERRKAKQELARALSLAERDGSSDDDGGSDADAADKPFFGDVVERPPVKLPTPKAVTSQARAMLAQQQQHEQHAHSGARVSEAAARLLNAHAGTKRTATERLAGVFAARDAQRLVDAAVDASAHRDDLDAALSAAEERAEQSRASHDAAAKRRQAEMLRAKVLEGYRQLKSSEAGAAKAGRVAVDVPTML